MFVYAQCPNAALKELHFIRCETDRVDPQRFAMMMHAQQSQYVALMLYRESAGPVTGEALMILTCTETTSLQIDHFRHQ